MSHQILFVSNSSLNSGKSTTAFNLALCFAAMGKKTLLLEYDLGSWVKKLLNPKLEIGVNRITPFLCYGNEVEVEMEVLKEFDNVLIDVPGRKLKEITKKFHGDKRLLIPVECEYYGMNNLKTFLNIVKQCELQVHGFVPVMFRNSSESSRKLLSSLKEMFGNLVFEPAIQRNYYLARQQDFNQFSQSELTEKAAVTYLNLANNLLEK